MPNHQPAAQPPGDQAAAPFPPLDGDAIVLTGATASGKSGLALALAQQIGGEIISVDSIAVYRGMDIGTAKPTVDQQALVPHHLIDVAWPDQDYSVASFLSEAWQQIAAIRSRGNVPILVGGTPLYLKGLLYGLDPGPAADWEFRQAIEADLQRYGQQALHERLWQVDPLSAHRLHPTDVRRITRALEVAYLTGQPLSHRQTQFAHTPADLPGRLLVVQWPRQQLHQRIATRVDAMFDAGLIDEVQTLQQQYPQLSRTARIAVGYREVLAMLGGQLDLPTARQQVIEHTRQLARRQETWLRSLKMLLPLTVGDDDQLLALVGPLVEQLRSITRD